MTHLAWRNLTQNRVRLLICAGGVALALSLILVLDAVMVGMERQLAAYIERSGADVWVSQKGVRNLHMVFSSLPRSAVEKVAAVPGVATATPILYMTEEVTMGRDRRWAYIIGLPENPAAGRPWRVVAGSALPGAGEVILDRSQAAASGVGLGDPVRIFGRSFKVAGLSEGTLNIINSVAFIPLQDFARLRRSQEVMSFVLVRIKPGERPEEVAGRIKGSIPAVTAQSRQAIAAQERRIIRDMGADAINIMNLIGLLIGLSVMALTVYTATLSRRGEYGVLKAMGARNSHLYWVVLAQAYYSVGLGFVLALALTVLLSVVVPLLSPNLALELSGVSLLKVGLASLVIAGAAALLPIRQIAGLDPAQVYRGGAR